MVPQTNEKLDQLERLLRSRVLHGSESLRAFLRFVVLKSVESQDSPMKEYTIASEVFGRGASYDSRSDSTVRVQAGRLRTKLQEYYATEGKHDRVLIDLPKGQYSPSFSYIEELSRGENGPNVIIPALMTPETAAGKVERRMKYVIALLAVVAFALGGLAFTYNLELHRLRESSAFRDSSAGEVQSAMPLWHDFLRSSDPVLVGFSNTRFEGTAETGMRLLKPMRTPGANAPASTPELPQVITEHYTGVGEVMGVYAMGEFFYKAGHSIRVKRSLLLTWDDLKNNDIVILGSPAENYLLRELPQKQDFVFRMTKAGNDVSAFGVVNTEPTQTEQAVYLAKQEGPSRSQISEDYAVISLLRGLDENHRLLILAGITTFGTQAAAEYVTRSEHIKELISHLSVSQPGQAPQLPAYFQVLVKVKVNGGVPVQISYVTHHVL